MVDRLIGLGVNVPGAHEVAGTIIVNSMESTQLLDWEVANLIKKVH